MGAGVWQVGVVSEILYNFEPPRVYLSFLGSLQQPNLVHASPAFQLAKATYGAASVRLVAHASASATIQLRCFQTHSTPSPGGCSGQRACTHAQLGTSETAHGPTLEYRQLLHGSSTHSP